MSKGSKQRPGTGYADGWARIFGAKAQEVERWVIRPCDLPIASVGDRCIATANEDGSVSIEQHLDNDKRIKSEPR